ncbi:TPA: hypothetical protein J1Z12_003226 [Escherichia coli]|nr:hypothetical protein [Escherichia coli]HAZ3600562.1 hypothetical protein [Escherichia coli]
MLRKTVLASAMILVSATSYAGGGGSSWQPSVEPINCVIANGDRFVWRSSKDCNEVISHGYAKGVQYTGEFWYQDGSKMPFNALINPSNGYEVAHPQGKQLKGLINTQWSWLR